MSTNKTSGRSIVVKILTPERHYKIRDPKNVYRAMHNDIKHLLTKRMFVSLSIVIFSCLDALAAGSGRADRTKFEPFVTNHFPELCAALKAASPGERTGAGILYDEFRNGFVHLGAPNAKFAIAETDEMGGDWADIAKREGVGQWVRIDIERLAREFLKLLDLFATDVA
jgi:hypothetical protein